MPKALKSCPKSNKSPNLVTLHTMESVHSRHIRREGMVLCMQLQAFDRIVIGSTSGLMLVCHGADADINSLLLGKVLYGNALLPWTGYFL